MWSKVEEAHRRSERGPVSVKTLRRLRGGMIETRLALRRLRVEILETSLVRGSQEAPDSSGRRMARLGGGTRPSQPYGSQHFMCTFPKCVYDSIHPRVVALSQLGL